MISERGLAGTYFKTMNLPKCTDIRDSAFEDCTMQKIVLNSAKNLGSNVFKNCKNLEMIYAPKVKGFGECSGCTNLNLVFVPMAKGINVAIPNNATIYCSDKLTSIYFNKEYSDYKCTIVSPEYTPGLAIANSYGEEGRYIHISSDDFGVSKAGEYRRSDAGLRFGFTFDSSKIGFDFNEFAQNTEYGFVYSYNDFSGVSDSSKKERLRANKSNPLIKSADNRIVDGTVSTYNAVFTDIPAESAADGISVRSYFCIDGMYFYSPVVTYSLSSVSDYSDNSEADNDIKYDHIHSYVKKNIGPFCATKGYTMYECNGCGKSYIVDYIEPVGHKYKFVDAKNGLLNYQCPYCDNNITKSKSELPIFIDYVNTKVVRGNDNMYLDLNNDGYINAKDYALLNKISN